MADRAATPPRVAGLLLAAGAGRRFGGPKALVELDGEPLVRRALRTLTDAGCAPVRVVVGAAADEVRKLVPDPVQAIHAEGWEGGMGASLKAGLAGLAAQFPENPGTNTGTTDLGTTESTTDRGDERGAASEDSVSAAPAAAALTTPDTADEADQADETAPVAVLVHLVDLPWVPAEALARVVAQASPSAVVRAAYDGVPGHPVLFGRRWWGEVAESAQGDRGARDWLRGRGDVVLVECGDLGSGRDVDRPADLGRTPKNEA
ncbi:nucleotidyltransferase family protein [Amycolatopsis rhabdoformis]|uniref:Nucleotidyltransferase family protein n=1 Tax=Amycolatopsis rhabdoformis TaxID=1448059 RepID=A0ABZ1I7X3_9PSEU|nr:nucleotidyltransferase family protein [Amycolatopsis rhabdoformis]WSE30309.1 nucleotidyltransferase family protein [Amycolatopsis rhabdoformis]